MDKEITFQKDTFPKVFVTRKLPDIVETRMMELFNCHFNTQDKPYGRDELIEAMQKCDVLVPTVTDIIDAEMISKSVEKKAKGLRMIASFGNGTDHLDVPAINKANILLTNTPDVLTEDTADITMAMILALLRRLSEAERFLRAGHWQGWSPGAMLGSRIGGKKLGIIGMGRIGSAVAKRAAAFGLCIHYHNRNQLPQEQEQALNATYWPNLDQMLTHMDIICVNCPSSPASWHLLNARRLNLLKPHSFIVNTSRGDIIDEDALLKTLKLGGIAGAALDVYSNEPYILSGFLKLENVLLLPHIGSATQEGRIAMGEKILINIRAFQDNHRPPDTVIANQF